MDPKLISLHSVQNPSFYFKLQTSDYGHRKLILNCAYNLFIETFLAFSRLLCLICPLLDFFGTIYIPCRAGLYFWLRLFLSEGTGSWSDNEKSRSSYGVTPFDFLFYLIFFINLFFKPILVRGIVMVCLCVAFINSDWYFSAPSDRSGTLKILLLLNNTCM